MSSFKAGWLLKKSGGKEGKRSFGNALAKYDRRYFVCDEGKLSWYKKERDPECVGSLELLGAHIATKDDVKIKVTSRDGSRTLTLKTDTPDAREAWIAVLRRAAAASAVEMQSAATLGGTAARAPPPARTGSTESMNSQFSHHVNPALKEPASEEIASLSDAEVDEVDRVSELPPPGSGRAPSPPPGSLVPRSDMTSFIDSSSVGGNRSSIEAFSTMTSVDLESNRQSSPRSSIDRSRFTNVFAALASRRRWPPAEPRRSRCGGSERGAQRHPCRAD